MTFKRRSGSGRPRQTSGQEDHLIVRNAHVPPTVSSAAIQAQAAPSLGAPVSSRTIRRSQAEGHLRSTAAKWNQVVFIDESRFNLSSDANRVRVWRPRGELLNPTFALQRHTAPTAGAIFQQDNALPHTARVSQDCLRTVTNLPWPARSPDLSPIEHI
ncbi:transposable element Tcb2 transposase [Trichonephila clavipes]|nr:transposable element Tcb2 transposase [Trichonephila clavipes]